ncbi:DcrB-related protein [Trinickia caryophylli]|uniref:DUF1795 domain-containing protein n=1 Tax=Trinickia caryophylli TaxID=28094 RepID=A0A1X7F9B8_TRICW|nr:DcrB-related protein [Trinickia caryophylli]PMS08893.1 DUF1795 domain-containing protein [Trinickia caryophylli]TRX18976.1 DUF1795 domain-containing protein [Trinickia caryophylli]WQE10225.1 DcrB-related protein [Trinickia caryophylli]SMF48149.1 hypothetical protein SAMN06295900_10828 [Trinickia caryophylli]GLU34333.1 hypothetical protein Busp01_41750 [Trinickia caryophylli]
MPEYQMNDASIELPARFQDKTLHLFTVDEAGKSPFTFVVSRAQTEPDDTVDTFVTRLVAEMRKSFLRFQLKQLSNREIDGETAREIDYQWVSDGTLLHQRQTVVFQPLDGGETRQAVSFIGTCQRGFTPEWTQEYDDLVRSVKLKKAERAFTPTALDPSTPGVVFVLHENSKTLYSVGSMAELFRHDIKEMFEGVTFYDAKGAELALRPAPEGREGWGAGEGAKQFLLWTVDPKAMQPLQARLSDLAHVKGPGALSTVQSVRAYLASAAESA